MCVYCKGGERDGQTRNTTKDTIENITEEISEYVIKMHSNANHKFMLYVKDNKDGMAQCGGKF